MVTDCFMAFSDGPDPTLDDPRSAVDRGLGGDGAGDPDGMIGASPVLRSLLSRARKVAPTDSSVLITGETGTGKELLARSLHRRSRRSGGPFVSVHCASIPHALIASELFGHERGAFTGALQRRLGRFELAAGGTLFLDEVGEIPAETQVALLRVLQEREFERVGGSRPIRADVRIIAATNRDLESAVSEGEFRSDLYYRLAVFPLHLPPLRERGADVQLLARWFVERAARRAGRSFRGISTEAGERIASHAWPGNVRELENVIERSVIVCESDWFCLDETWLEEESDRVRPATERASARPRVVPASPSPASGSNATTLEEIEREAIVRALQHCNGVVGGSNGAAKRLGIKRTTLQARMQKLGIRPARVLPPRGDAGDAARRSREVARASIRLL